MVPAIWAATVTLPREVQDIYLRHADESLQKHRRDPADMCDWCAAVWRRQVPYPCFAARIAIAIRQKYRAGAGRGEPAHEQGSHTSRESA